MTERPIQPKAAAKAKSARAKRPTARMGLGRRGEQIAADWLAARGLRIIERNWRCPYGELDLIAEEVVAPTAGASAEISEIVGVEVKTRRGERMGVPEEAVTPAKQRRLIATLQSYLAARDAEHAPYRIDVVAIELASSGKLLDVRHHRSAVTLDE